MKNGYRKRALGLVAALLLIGTLPVPAAAPPESINFQGVLRDASGAPIDGAVDMAFVFFDSAGGGCPAAGGTQLLLDAHSATNTGAVQVSGGLFNVELGGGNLVAGTESSLADVFRNYAAVYVEVRANTGGVEILCPRIRVFSSAYSLNADHVDGKDSSELLDTSATSQVKSGDLTVQDLTVTGSLTGDLTVSGMVTAGTGGVEFPDGTVQTTAAGNADGPCFDTANRYVDCGNGTVTDTATGLIWLKDANCLDLADDGAGTAKTVWVDANLAAAQLTDGQCGLTDGSTPGDWRLPTKEEAQAVLDQAVSNGCSAPKFPDTVGTGCCGVDPCLFSGVVSGTYWTSVQNTATIAWCWSTNNGMLCGFGKELGTARVWPVR